MSLSELVDELYTDQPQQPLYHYTSVGSLTRIVESKSLYATDIRYFNDASEMRYAADRLRSYSTHRIVENLGNAKLWTQLRDWLSFRLTDGHMLFVVSFTLHGNLLSQWRGYCPPGKGVSIGFNGSHITGTALNQNFRVGRCIYDSTKQDHIADRILDKIQNLAEIRGENLDASKRHPDNSFYGVFEEIEDDLLRVAALLKHPSFAEEDEWRAVSPVTTDYVKAPIMYREGTSMLIPYIWFSLPTINGDLAVERVVIGPTPNMNQSFSAVSRFLSKARANPRQGTHNCQVPYRAW